MKRFAFFIFLCARLGIAGMAEDDQAIQAAVQNALNVPCCRAVRVSVQSGAITLGGSVDLYAAKLYAEKRAGEIHRGALRSQIQVTGPDLPDSRLKANLKAAIDHRNIPGAGEASRWISIRVKDGVVTLGGHANGPTLSAVAMAVAEVPGVKDLILNVRVFSDTFPSRPIEWPPAGESVGGVSVGVP